MDNDSPRHATLAAYSAYVASLRASGQEPPVLMLDNDDATAYDERADVTLLSLGPRALLEQALDLLGLPHERV